MHYGRKGHYSGARNQCASAHRMYGGDLSGRLSLIHILLFSTRAKPASVVNPTPAGSAPPTVRPREYGTPIRWEQANAEAPINSQFLVVDLTSQLYFTAVRTGGTTHMEIEPANAEQTARYLSIFSGAGSYEKRPCLIEYNLSLIHI